MRKDLSHRILEHGLRHNGSYRGLESVSEIVNSTPNSSIKVPDTKYKIKQFTEPIFNWEMHLKCRSCGNYTPEAECTICISEMKTSNCDHYFVYIPLEQQLREYIQKYFDDIISYHSFIKTQKNVIADVHHSIQYKKGERRYPNTFILPLNVNTDGARVFNSSNDSLWIIQCYQSYLPPNFRFVPENIIVTAAHFGPKKPDMKTFFYPFLLELRNINEKGGLEIQKYGKYYNFMPIILNCCCDLPAKAEVQCFTTHSGHFGCGYCYHPGVAVKSGSTNRSYLRYIYQANSLRTHQSTDEIYRQLKSVPIKGVKGVSCMIAAQKFDIIDGFGIDYMHCVLLGAVKKLLNLWLDSKHHLKPFHVSKGHQTILNDRILKIKVISEIARKPRSIFNRADFKANEYRGLLLYFLPIVLPDLLRTKYIDHFRLLSSAIYILLKESISDADFNLAKIKLEQFVKQFEVLYGQDNVTMNIHMIKHIPKAVNDNGPLWSQSLFGFEANNGVIVKANTCKDKILQQLAWKYSLSRTINKREQTSGIKLFAKSKIQLSSRDAAIINSNSKLSSPNDGILMIYKKVERNGKIFKCLESKEMSTVDHFVKTKNDVIAAIKFYFVSDSIIYALIEKYNVIKVVDQISYVEPAQIQMIITFNDISEKLLFKKVRKKQTVALIPNKFEKT